MLDEIVAIAQTRAKRLVRSVAIPAALALVGGVFVLFAVIGLFAALFYWLELGYGPIAASLICAAVAIVLAIASLLPAMFKRRPPRPPPASEGTLPQFVLLAAKGASRLTPRQLVVTAALLGAALVLSARGENKRKR